MYTLEEIATLRETCYCLNLENAGILIKYSDEELQTIFNGIGPETFPKFARKLVDAINPLLLPVALIHDVEWYESVGTYKNFKESNSRMRTNGEICAKSAHAWYNPLRYLTIYKAHKLATLCDLGGWEFYKSCCERRRARCVTS